MTRKNTEGGVTIKDIAAMCEVSISTVSNFLNGKSGKVSPEVAERIRSCVEKTGYKPNYLAKNLRSLSTKTIGVIAEDLIMFNVPSIIEGIMRVCEKRGYNVVIENMRLFGRWQGTWMHDEALFQSALQPVLSKMEALNVDGIIYVGGHEHTVRQLKSQRDIPVVMTYAVTDDPLIPSFRLDDFSGGYEAFGYLYSKGHKRIGVIAGFSDNAHTINRMQGIQKAVYEEGILFDPGLVVYKTWDKEGGYSGMKELLSHNVTAVFCMSDQIAAGAYACLEENGLKPGEDISVMGYDNQDISSCLTPELTTMALPLEEMGTLATERLLEMCGDASGTAVSVNTGADPETGKASENPGVTETSAAVENVRIRSKLIERNSVKKLC